MISHSNLQVVCPIGCCVTGAVKYDPSRDPTLAGKVSRSANYHVITTEWRHNRNPGKFAAWQDGGNDGDTTIPLLILDYFYNYFIMPDRCVVFACDSTPSVSISLHSFPELEPVCRQWIKFVQRYRKDFKFSSSSRICSLHFTPSDFVNYYQFTQGFCSRLSLKAGAVPSVQPSPQQIASQVARGPSSQRPPSKHAIPTTAVGPNPKRLKVERKLSAARVSY